MSEPRSYHMSPEDFRRHGHAVIDWIANYMREVDQLPVLSSVKPGDIRAKLPDHPPHKGESFESMMRDVDAIILPGIAHWQSPSFFGYFPCNNSGPGILGELLSAGLGIQGMLWSTSPACTELETHMLDWMARMLALPEKFMSRASGGGGGGGGGGGVIQDSASSASLCALLAARERVKHAGTLVAYASTQAHSSIEKAMMIAGLGRENLRLIPGSHASDFALDPSKLRDAIQQDVAKGLRPFFVCATVGTTSSNAIDPVRAIGEAIRDLAPQAWLHIDAAMSGIAAICPEFRFIHDGLELADSYCTNPHKWMYTNFDCDCFWVADRAALINALSVLPEYLKNKASESGSVIDYRDWQIPLGRRFRALKLWFVIRHYGVEGLQHHIREHIKLAREFASWVRSEKRFELIVDPALNLVCFRLRSGDEANQRLLDRLNASGKMFLTHTKLDDKLTLRMSIGQTHTRREHVEAAWQLIREVASA